MNRLSSRFSGVARGCFAAFSGLFLFAGAAGAVPVRDGFYVNSQYSPIVDLIAQSRTSLAFEIYEMDDPAVIAAIRGALGRGVKVHVVKEPDPVGGTCKVFGPAATETAAAPRVAPTSPADPGDPDSGVRGGGGATCEDQQALVRQVRAAGGTYVPFNKAQLCGVRATSCLEHGKIAIADSTVALVTTGNFNTSNLCDLRQNPLACNRDYSFISHDRDVVASLEGVVAKDTAGQHYDMGTVITPGARLKLTVGPYALAPLVAFIKSARRSIQIENQYLKEPTINNAIVAAAQAGVQVQITVASACAFGFPSGSEKTRLTSIFSVFDAAGISSRMFTKNVLINGKPGYMHAKAIVVDGTWAWVGSVNGSTQATSNNREFGIFFNEPAFVRGLSDVLYADHTHPKTETWQESLVCAEGH